MVVFSSIIFWTLSSVAATSGEPGAPLTVTVFYESYSPDSIQFILSNTIDAFRLVKKNQILLDLVPFGKAEQSYVHGHFEFRCQNNPEECLGNKLHACAIWLNCGKSGTLGCPQKQLVKALGFVYCVVQHQHQLWVTRKCAKGVIGEKIVKCAKGDVGSRLLSAYGNQTMNTKNGVPTTHTVPTVLIDGKHYDGAEDYLLKVVCKLRPEACEVSPRALTNGDDFISWFSKLIFSIQE